MKTQIHEDPRIVAAAERKMQAWVHAQETADRAVQGPLRQRLATSGRTYVAVSRKAGIDAAEIARPLGQQLGWEVLDRTLLDRVAERLHGSRTMLDIVNETQGNWVYDVLGAWLDGQIVTHEKYVACLTRGSCRRAAGQGRVRRTRGAIPLAAGEGACRAIGRLREVSHRTDHEVSLVEQSAGPAMDVEKPTTTATSSWADISTTTRATRTSTTWC